MYRASIQIGGLQDVVALDHALGAGNGNRLDLRAHEAVLGPQVARRPDRGVRGGVARTARQHRAVDDEFLAETAGQPVRRDQLWRWLTPVRR
jgi:hypothetical protein